MTIQQRVEAMETDKLKACAIGLFKAGANSAGFDAAMIELERRLQDEFAAWCDANF